MINNTSQTAALALQQGSSNKVLQKADALTGLKKTGNGLDMAAIDAAAKDFEAVFVSEMIKPMFEGIKVDATFGGGKGEEMFRGLMIDEYGKMISQTGQVGIADAVKEKLIEMQSKADKTNTAANDSTAPAIGPGHTVKEEI